MKTILKVLALALVVMVPNVEAGDYDKEIAASRETVKEFMQTLKGELQAGMKEGGPVNAISVCNLSAPAIANTYSIRNGWDVGRTSLKLRNPDNAPDVWERKVLVSFDERKRAGEDPMKMEHYEVVRKGGSSEFRYMKAIPTAPLCLACHGEKLDSITRERIEKLYPRDQALGYKQGDIRGAFTITQPLPDS
jgi:hypothetical protein